MVTKSEVEGKAVKGDITATLLAMNGLNETKDKMDSAVGSAGLPWCGGFVKKMFEVSGYGDALKGIGNPLYVPSYIEDGKRLGLVETIKDKPPSVGSIITFKDQNHIGVVSKVEGDKIFITQGNTTDMVQTLEYTMADFKNKHLDSEYLSAEKLNKYMSEQPKYKDKPAPVLGDSKLLKGLPTYAEAQEEIKKNGAINSYDMFSKAFGINKDKPEETEKDPLKNTFAQVLLALLMLASGQKVEIEKSATEAERRATLENVDNQLREAKKPTPIKAETVTSPSSPPATPLVKTKIASAMGVESWR